MRFLGILLLTCLSAACAEAPAPGQAEAARGRSEPEEPIQAPERPDPTGDMVEIPAGPFIFGADERQFQVYLRQARFRYSGMEESERQRFHMPQSRPRLQRFFIDLFEVTNQQFQEFLEDSGYRPEDPADFLKHWDSLSEPPSWAGPFPVVWVSPVDAQAYCHWVGGRLPTEREWEKAARGEEGLFFPWGDKGPSRETAVWGNHERPEPVGNRPGDESPYGVYDMGGNVAEWTGSTVVHRGEAHRVARGGAFNEIAREMLVYNRRLFPVPAPRADNIGFRCAASPM